MTHMYLILKVKSLFFFHRFFFFFPGRILVSNFKEPPKQKHTTKCVTCEGLNILPGNMQYVRMLEICLPSTYKGNIWRVSFETLKRFIFYS